jgi:hypothetical protein
MQMRFRWKTNGGLARAVLAFALVSAGLEGRADELVRRVQEELRKRHLYFGDVDGRQTPETEAAIRRYQERKGFAGTGAATPETLRSLGLGPVEDAEPWPELPVLRSDAARAITQQEQERMERLVERGELPPIGEAVDEKDLAIETEPPAEIAKAPVRGDLVARVEKFLRDYLKACESNDLAAELAFYADRVDYFDHGTVDRPFLEHDIGERYYKRWPQRRYRLLAVRVVPPAKDSEEIEVRFRLRFDVKGATGAASGQTENRFIIRQGPRGEMRFVSMRERRVRG